MIPALYVYAKVHFTKCTLTTRRILIDNGWLSKKHFEVPVEHIRGAAYTQTVWQKLTGTGDVSVATSGMTIMICGVPCPSSPVSAVTLQVRRAEKLSEKK